MSILAVGRHPDLCHRNAEEMALIDFQSAVDKMCAVNPNRCLVFRLTTPVSRISNSSKCVLEPRPQTWCVKWWVDNSSMVGVPRFAQWCVKWWEDSSSMVRQGSGNVALFVQLQRMGSYRDRWSWGLRSFAQDFGWLRDQPMMDWYHEGWIANMLLEEETFVLIGPDDACRLVEELEHSYAFSFVLRQTSCHSMYRVRNMWVVAGEYKQPIYIYICALVHCNWQCENVD